MSRLELELPSDARRDSYRSLVAEIQAAGEKLVPFPLAFENEDFTAFLKRLAAAVKGENVPPGFVPNTTYWLVRDDAEVVAVSNLRHELTERLRVEGGHIGYGVRPSARRQGHATEILRLTLLKARELGIDRALLTCDRTNVGSIRAILKNGGVFEGEQFIEHRGGIVQRYWIDVP